jgi:predicted NBD/HSP70 family sugar kinase
MAVANRDLIRAINRFNLINTIRTSGPIARVDISRNTGLSQATVTAITADLIAEGLLCETATAKSQGGRRPILLALNPEGAYALGVYLSIHQINIVIIDFEAKILAEHSMALNNRFYSPKRLVGKIGQALQACMWQANFAKEQICGVGIGIPGLVDSQTGLIRFLPNYQWENVNLRDLVERAIDHPTYIENSANTLTIAEQWFGQGRGTDNFILITLEHGVGMGVVINGQLYRGAKGIAGECGHMTIDPRGAACRCGQRGCLEATVGNHAIIRQARMAADGAQWQPQDRDNIHIDEVLQAALDGEPALRRIFARAGHTLGIALTNLMVLLNPSKIFICGKGTAAGAMLFDSMYAAIPQYLSKNLDSRTQVIVKQWSQTDYARGAGAMVLQEIYKHPISRMVPLI